MKTMKSLFLMLMVLSLGLMGCPDPSGDNGGNNNIPLDSKFQGTYRETTSSRDLIITGNILTFPGFNSTQYVVSTTGNDLFIDKCIFGDGTSGNGFGKVGNFLDDGDKLVLYNGGPNGFSPGETYKKV